jgi:SAM-dependent methyltransferase
VGRSGQPWEAVAHEWAAHVRGGRDKPFEWNAPPFFDSLPPPRGLTVEVGCGEGRVTRELRARGYDVAAFDVSETLVMLAREADPEGNYGVADAAMLPIGDGAAALFVAFNVLHEIADLSEAIAEAARALALAGHSASRSSTHSRRLATSPAKATTSSSRRTVRATRERGRSARPRSRIFIGRSLSTWAHCQPRGC